MKKDGTTIPVVIQATHIKKGNKVIGVRGVIVDITQVEHAKKLIEKAKNDLEETIKERSFELKLTNAKLQRIIQETISALSFAIEKRDPYTAGHQQRVAQLTSAIAEKLGFSLSRIKGLHMAALIHDIGKIYVPAEILSKPAQLNKIEFDIIRLHSKVGYDILHTIEFPWPIAQAVLQHHERLDGSGYPFRLTDDEISMEAKIIAVADVVEAMASHRPYRPALGMDKALKEISKNKGILYDPTIVTVCEKLITKETFKFK
ncbi:MAG: HD domain-containing protein [Candidatus Omnitrophica bacterium]|nr:HD domain-containing protein [Candidatus Omnitrophota bacterium]